MTIEEVMVAVQEETGEAVTPETKLSILGMDSLEFLDLLVRLSIPDSLVPSLDTVRDLHTATQTVQ
jgi:acyl carrier protein